VGVGNITSGGALDFGSGGEAGPELHFGGVAGSRCAVADAYGPESYTRVAGRLGACVILDAYGPESVTRPATGVWVCAYGPPSATERGGMELEIRDEDKSRAVGRYNGGSGALHLNPPSFPPAIQYSAPKQPGARAGARSRTSTHPNFPATPVTMTMTMTLTNTLTRTMTTTFPLMTLPG
jgi:hypothetical protein